MKKSMLLLLVAVFCLCLFGIAMAEDVTGKVLKITGNKLMVRVEVNGKPTGTAGFYEVKSVKGIKENSFVTIKNGEIVKAWLWDAQNQKQIPIDIQ